MTTNLSQKESKLILTDSLDHLKKLSIRGLELFSKVLARLYQIVLSRVIIKIFPSPEVAICSAFNAMEASPARVLSNFYQGMVLIGQGQGLVWKTFPERAIITPETAHIPKRVKAIVRKQTFEIRYDADFDAVVECCKRDKTWINPSVISIYRDLFQMGHVRTLEAYQDGRLVGGLWGIVIGETFSIMSMFHRVNNAGSIALATLVSQVEDRQYKRIDCGVINNNFIRYGASNVSREEFVECLVLTRE